MNWETEEHDRHTSFSYNRAQSERMGGGWGGGRRRKKKRKGRKREEEKKDGP